MPSPFPGMDPYLENSARWRDFHQRLMTYACDAIQPLLPPKYLAQLDERLTVGSTGRQILPDVTVLRTLREAQVEYAVAIADAPPPNPLPAAPTLPQITEPIRVRVDHVREPYIEIIQPETGEVITVIEVLSPTNKTDKEGRKQYEQKRHAVLHSTAHLVEIDLLSQGEQFSPPIREANGELRSCRYVIAVNRAEHDRSDYELYPLALQDPLPNFRIPLRTPDADVTLDLQAVFTRCYDNGRYNLLLNYTKPPAVPLSDEEHTYAQSLISNPQ